MMRHVSISPRCFCCIGWHDAECAVPERAARSAAAPLFFAFFPPTRPFFRGRTVRGSFRSETFRGVFWGIVGYRERRVE